MASLERPWEIGQKVHNADSVAIVDGATDLDALIFCISARTLMGELNGGKDRAEARE